MRRRLTSRWAAALAPVAVAPVALLALAVAPVAPAGAAPDDPGPQVSTIIAAPSVADRQTRVLARAKVVLAHRADALAAASSRPAATRSRADIALARRDWEAANLAVAALGAATAYAATGGALGVGNPAAPPTRDQAALLVMVRAGIIGDAGLSARTRTAVSFALAQLGEPYLWGGNGPDRWDCSGLVQAAYRSAGVTLPRVAVDQSRVGRVVARSELRAGDLVFLAHDPHDRSTIHHVGMYLGAGLWVNAPRTGDVVRIAPVPDRGYAGAVRVLG